MIRALIIDDEKKARETISNMLRLYCAQVEIVGEADNINSAEELIRQHQPGLVFLDIQMPGGSGFDLLKRSINADFRVIFITAHSEYAIRAFKFSAIDYLLKPIDPGELVAAVNKLQTMSVTENMSLRLDTFFSHISDRHTEPKNIVLKTSESIHVINIKDIIRCEADGNYSNFHLAGGKKILVSNTLKEYDELLTPRGFFRVHQSHLVNTAYIESFEKKDGGFLRMKDGSDVPVSVRKKEQLLHLLENI
jgi:two-component system, LytTR family, response regulator